MSTYILSFPDSSSDNGYRTFLVRAETLSLAKKLLVRRCNKPDYPVLLRDIQGIEVNMPDNTIQEI